MNSSNKTEILSMFLKFPMRGGLLIRNSISLCSLLLHFFFLLYIFAEDESTPDKADRSGRSKLTEEALRILSDGLMLSILQIGFLAPRGPAYMAYSVINLFTLMLCQVG